VILDVSSTDDLRPLYRVKSKNIQTKSVHPKLLQDELADGWIIQRRGRTAVRLQRAKPHHVQLEDRVWTLLYRMQFDYLSGPRGARLPIDLRNPSGPTTQIDVVGIESDVALAIECKSHETYGKRSSFSGELAKLEELRDRFIKACNSSAFPTDHRRHAALAFFLRNCELSNNDRERAEKSNIAIFDESDLDYYEKLTAHLGPAAKYQFLADILPGRPIAGLEIKVPCVRSRLGKSTCYSFPLSPEYLLKISYVSHRSKGKRSDVNTYQRMLTKNRLNKIRQYISEDGVFPTNIVINLDKRRINFQRIKQEHSKDEQKESGVLGMLTIRPAYKSAWVIDGQHRLYAYSGHPKAKTSHLSVVAFEGLPPSKQAQLFIDINAKQKSVKQSLLQELFAELHWDSDKAEIQIQAVISKTVQVLDGDPSSPLYGRIQTADASRDSTRCISLTAVFNALEKNNFHIIKEKNGSVIEWGPLWAGNNEHTLERTTQIVSAWLGTIRDYCKDWWDLGAADGGGLAMNDGITSCINILKNVLVHLQDKVRRSLIHVETDDLIELIKPYAATLGTHFSTLSTEARKGFRDLRGVAGQTTRTRRCQLALRSAFPDFSPAGLDEFIEREKHQTNLKAKEVIDRIERLLQKTVIEELKNEFGDEESQWWMMGIPKKIRQDVAKRFEDDDGRRGSKEAYFDLIDYRAIALENWELLSPLIAADMKGNKEKRTKWMVIVNDRRNAVAHASSGISLSLEQVAELESYEQDLKKRLNGEDARETSDDDVE
jgi:DNA sulfur modification protein DndB